ncbi:glycosyltransferase family 4 protein, partial [Candidatus Jorgensenbacteria bacterium]|nr:glycosyltransferase family 4 protein [Candidatus Jorgensenbacteria bacterium]
DDKNQYQLFYNGFRKVSLPVSWLDRPNVSVIDWRIPNKILEATFRFLKQPKIDRFFKPDIVFSPHFNLLALRKNTRRVVLFHDLSPLHYPEFFPWRKRFWHWQQNLKQQAQESKYLIANSEFTGRDLMGTLGVSEDRVKVIYPGVNTFYQKLPHNDPGLQQFKKKYGLDAPFLLYVGVLEPRKNIGATIKTFNILKTKQKNRDLKLVIAGSRGWLDNNIFAEASRSLWANDIKFWGEAKPEHILYLYNAARVFVYPSFFEGFGFPPLEAQRSGLPVVASNRSSLPEILAESALLVDPWRTDELTDAVDSLLNDNTLRAMLRERGIINAERFKWENAARSFLKVFESI